MNGDLSSPAGVFPTSVTSSPTFAEPAMAKCFEICKLHASTDGAFDDKLTVHWFQAAFDLCADFAGLIYPPRKIRESVVMDYRGRIHLSHPPSSKVQFVRGPNLVAELPPDSPCLQGAPNNCGYYSDPLIWGYDRSCCPAALCECMGSPITAIYWTGSIDCNDEFPAMFVQAVARVFAFICENRGDTQLNELTLQRCNAMTFLQRYVTFVL